MNDKLLFSMAHSYLSHGIKYSINKIYLISMENKIILCFATDLFQLFSIFVNQKFIAILGIENSIRNRRQLNQHEKNGFHSYFCKGVKNLE